MKKTIVIISSLLLACGGSLSDEQRKQLREKMEENKIVRVTEVEITETAFSRGRALADTLASMSSDSAKLKSFIDRSNGAIRFLRPGEHTNRLLEKQLIDAYLADPSGTFRDNLQKIRNADGDFDTLLYTKPVMRKSDEGADELIGVWNILLTRKDVVASISKNK